MFLRCCQWSRRVFTILLRVYTREKNEPTFLTTEEQGQFVDYVLMPAINTVLSRQPSLLNRLPVSFKQVVLSGKQTFSSFNLRSEDLNDVITEMRNLVSPDSDQYMFHDFFFKTVSFGSKTTLEVQDEWSSIPLLKGILNLYRYNSCFVDAAVNVSVGGAAPSICFLRQDKVEQFCRPWLAGSRGKISFIPFSLAHFGNISFKSTESANSGNLEKLIGYSDLKYQFSGPNGGRGGSFFGRSNDDFEPRRLQQANQKTIRKLTVSTLKTFYLFLLFTI